MQKITSVQASVNPCLVCGGNLHPSPIKGLLQCNSCDFITANIDIGDDELAKLYGKDYFHGEEYLNYNEESESLRVNFRRRISDIIKLYPSINEADLFEIGCAYGYFLKEVAPMVKTARGIDVSSDAVAEAVNYQKVNAVHGDYLTYDIDRPVDIITMWDTIEHLRRPDLFIQKAYNDLKSNGILAITTGDISALNARLRGGAWRMIHPPTHLHYFSVKTLTMLLQENGFQVEYVSHPGNARTLRSVLYFITVIKSNNPKLYKLMSPWSLFDLSLTVNLFDIMFVVARKIGTADQGGKSLGMARHAMP